MALHLDWERNSALDLSTGMSRMNDTAGASEDTEKGCKDTNRVGRNLRNKNKTVAYGCFEVLMVCPLRFKSCSFMFLGFA